MVWQSHEFSPRLAHKYTVIILHGLGDNGTTWLEHVKEWNWPQAFAHTKFVFPTAKMIAVTVANGNVMPAWYDILSYNDLYGGEYDESGIRKSIEDLQNLILREIDYGIPSHNIILGGFSQGGAVALLAGLSSSTQLGGVFGLSTYLPMLPEVQSLVEPTAVTRDKRSETPVWMGHGMNDALVKYLWGKQSSEKICEMGWNAKFHGYEHITHALDFQEIADLRQWISTEIGMTTEPSFADERGPDPGARLIDLLTSWDGRSSPNVNVPTEQ